MLKGFLIAIFAGILSSFSQILLKKGAEKKAASFLRQYMNLYVFTGYGITALCMILMIIAYRDVPLKYGSVLEALTYVYIMFLSRWLLDEKLTLRKMIGNLLIIIGVLVFSIGR